MTGRLVHAVALALVLCAPAAAAEIASMQILIIEGEAEVQTAGARSRRPITVQVTEATGKPVNGAVVSFRLPEDHGSLFANGMKTEIVTTGADGRAAVWGIEWGKQAGPVRIRITASKDQVRAGAILTQQVGGEVAATPEVPADRPVKLAGGGSRWKLIAFVAGGAAAGALSAGLVRKGPAATPAAAAAVHIGAPAISVSRP